MIELKVFHAGDGDCVLLTARQNDGGEDETSRVLVDGGRKQAFVREARDIVYSAPIDLVVVSHIDDDHISGILQLAEDALEHRLNAAREEIGEDTVALDFPAPEIRRIWHNTVYDLIGEDLAPQAHEALVTSAALLAGSSRPELRELAASLDNLATGEAAAMELSRRVSPHQLDIPRNEGHDLILAGSDVAIGEGGLRLRVFAPKHSDLDAMKQQWKDWVDEEKDKLRKLRRRLMDDERELAQLDAAVVANPVLAAELGEGSITAPNLASIMFVATDDDGHTVLMTGDGSSEAILEGLAELDMIDDGHVHVDVLKVQHHGALANVTEAFVACVSADHYVFCGNGNHHNPELEVVEAFVRARLRQDDPVGPQQPFCLYFTSSEKSRITATQKKHMKKVRELLEGLKDELDSEDLHFRFLDEGHFDITLGRAPRPPR